MVFESILIVNSLVVVYAPRNKSLVISALHRFIFTGTLTVGSFVQPNPIELILLSLTTFLLRQLSIIIGGIVFVNTLEWTIDRYFCRVEVVVLDANHAVNVHFHFILELRLIELRICSTLPGSLAFSRPFRLFVLLLFVSNKAGRNVFAAVTSVFRKLRVVFGKLVG